MCAVQMAAAHGLGSIAIKKGTGTPARYVSGVPKWLYREPTALCIGRALGGMPL